MYNVNAMGRNSGYQSRSPASYVQNTGRCHWWLPVVPEMDAMAAAMDGVHDSSGLHDNNNNSSGGGGGNGNGSGGSGGSGSGSSGSDPLMSQAANHDLGGPGSHRNSPHMTNTNNNNCDANDFRSMSSSEAANAVAATYAAAFGNGGRHSPFPGSANGSGQTASYATLTPLQPLPPISSVSEKFSQQQHQNAVSTPQGFHFITPNHQLSVHNITNTYQYAAAQFAPLLQSSYGTGAYTTGAGQNNNSPSSHSSTNARNSFSSSSLSNASSAVSSYENHLTLAALNYPSAGVGHTTSHRHPNLLAGNSATSPFTSSAVHSSTGGQTGNSGQGVSLTIQLPGGQLAVQSQFLTQAQHQQLLQESLENTQLLHHDRSTPNNHSSSSPVQTPNSSPRSHGGVGSGGGQIVVDNSPTNSQHSSGGGGQSQTGQTTDATGQTSKQHRSHRSAAATGFNNGKNGGGGNSAAATAAAAAAAAADELEEINTKELAQRISAELKRYSIPQAIFAQRVLCRSQGTLSDLLRNPKPWSKLKSGRETFRRMGKWLEEPEFQRMSALRLAGAWTPTPQNPTGAAPTPAAVVPQVNFGYQENIAGPVTGQWNAQQFIEVEHPNVCIKRVKQEEQQIQTQQQQHQDSPEPGNQQQPKKPRLVFTDIQRRTLQQIFKETKRPNKEMQLAISNQLGLELSTVGNFFMNARRRSQDKWQDGGGEGEEKPKKEGKSRVKKEPRQIQENDVKMEL